MTVNRDPSSKRPPAPPARGHLPLQILLAGLLGASAALLIACGGSSKGLIPSASAGPLQSDFESVAQAAQSGEGNCTATEAQIAKTEADFAALPATVDAALHKRLSLGIANLRHLALALCTQQLPQATSTTKTITPTTNTSTPTTPTTSTHTETTPPPSTPTTTSTPTAPTRGGGTPAPGSESQPGAPSGPGGGTGIGGESGSGGGAGGSGTPGGQENSK